MRTGRRSRQATLVYVAANGRRLQVPVEASTCCTHPPDAQQTSLLALGSNLRVGLVLGCRHGCYRGGDVGQWVWTGCGWRLFGAAQQAQARGLTERLGLDWRRGRTEPEIEAG